MPVSFADIPVTRDCDIPVESPFGHHRTSPGVRRCREAAPDIGIRCQALRARGGGIERTGATYAGDGVGHMFQHIPRPEENASLAASIEGASFGPTTRTLRTAARLGATRSGSGLSGRTRFACFAGREPQVRHTKPVGNGCLTALPRTSPNMAGDGTGGNPDTQDFAPCVP